jgi:hypothetical protein
MSNCPVGTKTSIDSYLAENAVVLGILDYCKGEPIRELKSIANQIEYERARQIAAYCTGKGFRIFGELYDLGDPFEVKFIPSSTLKILTAAFLQEGLRV